MSIDRAIDFVMRLEGLLLVALIVFSGVYTVVKRPNIEDYVPPVVGVGTLLLVLGMLTMFVLTLVKLFTL